jgi:Xaa-Pro aminopeptidase
MKHVDCFLFSRNPITKKIFDYLLLMFLGETWQSKVKRVRGALRALGADAQVVTALDEVAWLLNIRGRDAMFLPVARAYVILSQDKISMYVSGGIVPEPIANHLRTNNCLNDYCVR